MYLLFSDFGLLLYLRRRDIAVLLGLLQVVADATTLRLSYKNVLKIDNLQGFSRLTKLCLDNNIIESIRCT